MKTTLKVRWRRFGGAGGAGGGNAFAAYAVNSGADTPALIADFVNEVYAKNNAGSPEATTFDALVTYTGASLATMVDSDGALKWNAHNLTLESEDLTVSAEWGANNCTVGASVSDPDGGTDAFTLTATAANGQLFNLFVGSAGVTVDYLSGMWIRRRTGSGTVSFLTPNTSAVTPVTVTSDWTFVSITGPGSASNLGIGVRLATSGDAVDVYHPRCTRNDLGGMAGNPDRDTDTGYVPTPTASPVYMPRRKAYYGPTPTLGGFQLESAAATNLVTYSNDFTDASWTKRALTSFAQTMATLDPAGGNEAHFLVANAVSSTHGIYISYTYAATTDYGASIYAKAGGYDGLHMTVVGGESTNSAGFDLTNGTLVANHSNVSAEIEDVGNGWYRCSILDTSGAGGAEFVRVYFGDAANIAGTINGSTSSGAIPNYVGDTVSGIYVYGAQLEESLVATSYIPTNGSTATRAAQTATIAAANLPYSATAMSISFDGLMTYADTGVSLTSTGQSGEVVPFSWLTDASNFIASGLNTSGSDTGNMGLVQEAVGVSDSVLVGTSYYSPGINVPLKMASRHGATFINAAFDGTALTENSTPTSLPDLSAEDFEIGYRYNGFISQKLIWPKDIADAGMEETSTP